MREALKAPIAPMPLDWEGLSTERVGTAPKPPPVATANWIGRLFGRPEPTLYQRCLAVHIISASKFGALH